MIVLNKKNNDIQITNATKDVDKVTFFITKEQSHALDMLQEGECEIVQINGGEYVNS